MGDKGGKGTRGPWFCRGVGEACPLGHMAFALSLIQESNCVAAVVLIILQFFPIPTPHTPHPTPHTPHPTPHTPHPTPHTH
ncbi:MAG: hypothetical protein F6J93_13060 [Oscillatoria sp. SIO1A7]|nr:hypothetical protein [Oscillatoria sp. SIO1A7]